MRFSSIGGFFLAAGNGGIGSKHRRIQLRKSGFTMRGGWQCTGDQQGEVHVHFPHAIIPQNRVALLDRKPLAQLHEEAVLYDHVSMTGFVMVGMI